jgi:CheY-like chemotaxis protein
MAGELILIVEDNEKNRKLIRDVLQVKGYHTLETETAEEGHNLAVENKPALILMRCGSRRCRYKRRHGILAA